jgi:predicted PurR-regulated permease PerM
VIISSAIGAYLAAGFSGYVNGLIRLVRPDKRRRIREAFDVSLIALEGWMRGIVVSMTVLGVCSYIGLSLLGIPLAMALALLTAALTFIPNFGPFISVIPPVLLALGDNPMTAVYVIAFYIVLQNAEGLVITPLVQRRTAAIPPPLLLGVQVLMGALLGFLGLLFAAPLCAFAIVWVKLLYLEGRLKEHVEVAGHTSRC